jgi:hypothetical protein
LGIPVCKQALVHFGRSADEKFETHMEGTRRVAPRWRWAERNFVAPLLIALAELTKEEACQPRASSGCPTVTAAVASPARTPAVACSIAYVPYRPSQVRWGTIGPIVDMQERRALNSGLDYWVRVRFGGFITPWIEGWPLELVKGAHSAIAFRPATVIRTQTTLIRRPPSGTSC